MKFKEQQEGWTVERIQIDGKIFAICRPQEIGGGFIGIDFNRRVFDAGYGPPSRPKNTVEYAGRSWKDRIVADAVAYLNAVMA